MSEPFEPPVSPPIPPAQQALVEIATRKVLATGFFPSGVPNPDVVEIMDLDADAWAAFQAAPPGEKYLAEDGTLTVVPLPPPQIVYAEQESVYAKVRTADDQPLVVFQFHCDTKHVYRANLRISGVDTANYVTLIMEGRFAWKRVQNNAIMVGGGGIQVISDLHDVAAATWAPNCVPSGQEVVFTVKGAVGRTIDWLLVGEVGRFAPEGLSG